MRAFLTFAGRILLLCLPQTCLSAWAIACYAKAVIYPASAIGVHVAMIAALHVAFFSAWAWWSKRRHGAERAWFRGLFAASCLLKWAMLNLVYLLSYTSYRLWAAYISWENLAAIGPHLRGFHLALGWAFFAGLGAVAIVLLAYMFFALKTAPRALRWLEMAYAPTAAPVYSFLLWAMFVLLAGGLWLRDPNWVQAREMDPILAFWTNRAGAQPELTPAMLADRAAGQAYRPPKDFHRRNVIVVVVDCLRADHLAFRGYRRDTTPFLSSLARTGNLHRVDFAVACGNDSPQGIRTILSSRYPHQQNIHNFRLQDALKQAGYRTHVIATGDHTTLGGMRQHYGPNIDTFFDGLSSRAHTVNDDQILLEGLDQIERAGDQPAFFYIHILSVHTIGVREQEFARWQPALLRLPLGMMLLGHFNAEVMTNTYDNGLFQADHYLGEIFQRLKAKGYLEDYVAVLAGDHGEGLGERGNYGHTRFLFAEDMDIPIFFFESQPADYGPMPFASQVDIAPTLLDRLGLPKPERWAGKSLYQAPPPELTYAAGTRDSGWRAVLRRRDGEVYKYLFYGNKLKAFRECLYNETKDPRERTNLAAEPNYKELLLEFRQLAAKEFSRHVPPLD